MTETKEELPCRHMRRGAKEYARADVGGVNATTGEEESFIALVCVQCVGPLLDAVLRKLPIGAALVVRRNDAGQMTMSWQEEPTSAA